MSEFGFDLGKMEIERSDSILYMLETVWYMYYKLPEEDTIFKEALRIALIRRRELL